MNNTANITEFYTDSNGLGMIKRSISTTEPIGRRFFPVTSAITQGDASSWLTVFTDRTFSGSVAEGRTEILINRQLSTVDSSGLNEPLDEPGPNGKGCVLQTIFKLHLSSSFENA